MRSLFIKQDVAKRKKISRRWKCALSPFHNNENYLGFSMKQLQKSYPSNLRDKSVEAHCPKKKKDTFYVTLCDRHI